MNSNFARWVLEHRWIALLVSVAVVVLLASNARLLQFNNDYRVFFDGENPQLLAFENLQATYTKNDNVLLVIAPKDGDVFTKETLTLVKDVTERAWQTPYSIRVDSLSNYQHTFAEGDDLTVMDLVDTPESLSSQDFQSIRQIALGEPLLVRRLVSPQGHVTAVNVTIELPAEAHAEVPVIAQSVRELRQYILDTYPNVDVYLSGIVMMNNAFPEASQYDMQHLMPLAYVLILLMVFLLLRSFTGTFATLMVIALSIAGAMGFAGLVGFPLTPPLFSAPIIIMTLAVADGVHILSNWKQGMQAGLDKKAAMQESLRINAGPVFLTSVTTAIGFMSLNFSDAPPFRHLGNTAAAGVMLAWFLSMTLLPALVTLLPTRIKARESSSKDWMDRLADFVIGNKNRLLWGMGIFILALLAFIPKNQLNDIFVEYFDDRIEFRTHTDFIVENLTGVYFVDYSLNSQDRGVADPGFENELEQFASWLREQPEVMHVNTFTDIMKRLNRNMHGDDNAMYKIPDDKNLAAQYLLLYEMSLPYGLDLNNQIDINKQLTRLSVTLETLDTEKILEFEKRAIAWMEANTPSIAAWGSSPTIMFAHIGHQNIRSMLKGTVLALVLISLILIVALGSLRYGLLSLIPNLVPAGMAFGLWGLVNGNVGLSLSVVTAMTMGIVVDDTVHFLSKYLRAKREKKLSAEDAVRYAFSTVGVALLVTSVALVAGFLVLATSSFELNSGMGLLVSIVIVFAIIADFLFLPPLLIRLDQWLNNGKTDAVLTAEPEPQGAT